MTKPRSPEYNKGDDYVVLEFDMYLADGWFRDEYGFMLTSHQTLEFKSIEDVLDYINSTAADQGFPLSSIKIDGKPVKTTVILG